MRRGGKAQGTCEEKQMDSVESRQEEGQKKEEESARGRLEGRCCKMTTIHLRVLRQDSAWHRSKYRGEGFKTKP